MAQGSDNWGAHNNKIFAFPIFFTFIRLVNFICLWNISKSKNWGRSYGRAGL